MYEQQYNTSGTAREKDMDEEQKIYLETLKELNTRSISTRRITITFIYILLLATALGKVRISRSFLPKLTR
ncbi:hypothetical protein EXW84_03540 [Klebsiella pneumoniae]|nr:hypothetical protein [Klebsiella pneumoniae]